MKKFKVKVFLISMILLITGGITGVSLADGAATIDEFAELESSYESTSPKLNAAELSSTFTSEKEIEVYLETSRNDIDKIVISAWSGGAYSKFKTTKNATYDATREIYTATFNLDEIINTNTGAKENAEEALYSFDACVYGTNKTMSYYNLDNVQYTEKGFLASTKTSGDNVELTVKAEEDGEIAVLKDGEEVGENTAWQSVKKGENTISLMSLEDETNEDAMSSNVQTYSVVYKSPKIVSMPKRSIPVVTTNSLASSSTFQNNSIFTFEISKLDGRDTWVSYEDTPNILETAIQGKHGETAKLTVKIKTQYGGNVSFDYMISSEDNYDTFKVTSQGNPIAGGSGKRDWVSRSSRFGVPENGVITLVFEYTKDKNISRNEDKVAIKNLKFTPILPSNGKVVINGGAEYTENANLSLQISADNADYMYISEDSQKPSSTNVNWLKLEDTYEYTLQDKRYGEKTIYVWFKDKDNAMSQEATTATIKLDGDKPTNVAPSCESTATEIKIKLNQTDSNTFKTIAYGYKLANSNDEYKWINVVDLREYTVTGLSEKTEYEVVTRVSDGLSEVTSESTKIKTKISSDKIIITKTPNVKTLEDVDVTIKWNNNTYTKKYSLDNKEYIEVSEAETTIHMSENGTIYYLMTDGTYDSGILEYVVDNIDRNGPKIKSIGVVSPISGKYGIDDEITIKLEWDEEVVTGEAPVLNIKFDDDVIIPLTKVENDKTTITYVYKIKKEDSGYLKIESISGGLVRDALNNEASYEMPAQTGSEIFVENAAYIASKDTYYATLQNAVKAAGNEETIIKIVGNTALRETVKIKEGQNITIDLNGKTISIENDSAVVTAIENDGTLKIINTSENVGKINATSQAKSAYTIINNGTGKLDIKAGEIEAISNSTSVVLESYAIYNKESGEITLGIDDGIVSTTSPEIKAISRTSTGIKLTGNGGKLNYYDGKIKGTTSTIKSVEGATSYKIPAGYMDKIEIVEENGLTYKSSYLSNEIAVTLNMDGKTTEYLSIIDALEKIPADGREAIITVNSDETIREIIKIYNGQNITINLNGHTIKRVEEKNNAVYAIINNGKLILKDETNQGRIEAIAQKDVVTYALYNMESGDLTIDGVTLFASISEENSTENYYGLYNKADKIRFYDGKIYGKNIIWNNGEYEKTYLNPENVEMLENSYLHQGIEEVNSISYKINYVSSMPTVTLTVGEKTTGYSSIQLAIDAIKDSEEAIIKMEENEELFEHINIPKERNITLDLNGKTIFAYYKEYGIRTEANNLTIIDSTGEGLISVLVGYNTPEFTTTYGIYNSGDGNVTVSNGTINVNLTYHWHDSRKSYGIYNTGKGKVIITDATIISKSGHKAYGIYNKIDGTINIIDAKVESNTNSGMSNAQSYAIYNAESGDVNIEGSIINGMSDASQSTYVYAIYNADVGQVKISDSNICSHNYGVYNARTGTIKINSGNVSAIDKNQSKGIAMYINNVSSKVIIEGGELKGRENGIYISDGMRQKNGGEYEAGYVNLPVGKHISYKIENNYIINYLEDGPTVELQKPDGTKEEYYSLNEAIKTVPANGTLYKLKMVSDEFLYNNIEIEKNQNIDLMLNGKEIYGRANIVYAFYNNGKLLINDSTEEGTIRMYRYGSDRKNCYTIYNSDTGIININGGKITSSDYGIYNYGSGSINVNGGTISAPSYGVYNNGNGSINVNGGKISTSRFDREPNYGIYNSVNGTINVNGGKIASTACGIYNAKAGIVQMRNGEINVSGSGTHINGDSGVCGIYNLNDGRIKIMGGTITATMQYTSSQFTAYGVINKGSFGNVIVDIGKINALAPDYSYHSYMGACGLYNLGNLVVNDATITASTNSTHASAMGIRNSENGMTTINGGMITVHSSYSYGYGISNQKTGTVILNKGSIIVEGARSSYGIENNKGTIIIGKDDGKIDVENPIIKGTYAISSNTLGGDIRFYDGILEGRNSAIVRPTNTVFEYSETVQTDKYAINIPQGANIETGRDGNYYTKSFVGDNIYKLEYKSGQQVVEQYSSSLNSAVLKAPANVQTKIILQKDVSETRLATVNTNQNIILDLNGKNITFESEDEIKAITNNGKLQIIDSSTNGGGSINVTSPKNKAYAIYQDNANAVLTIGQDDQIVKQDLLQIYGKFYGIYINKGTLKMYDGKITGVDSIYGTATLPTGYLLKTIKNKDNIETSYLVKTNGITIVPERVGWINENQNIKIYYADISNTNQYKISSGEWQSLNAGDTEITIEVEENSTVYAQTLNASGDIIEKEEYEVKNIDKIKPTIQNVSITTGNGTKQTITLTGMSDEENGSGVKAYIITMDSKVPRKDAEWIKIEADNITYDVDKNGTWYAYAIDKAGNISEPYSVVAQNIDIKSPIVTNIEVVSPETGSYVAGTKITLNVNWSEEVVVTTAPTLKIKFGDGVIREATLESTGTNILTYTYTIQEGDYGSLNLSAYDGGVVKDLAGNAYQKNEIQLVGSKIDVQTRAYIEKTNTYYKTLQEAINSCGTEMTEYIKIKMTNDDEYYGTPIEIRAGQKIEIDLNGKKLSSTSIDRTISNNGELKINDLSTNQSGSIESDIYNNGMAELNIFGGITKDVIYNVSEGEINVTDGTINKIYNNGDGTVNILGGTLYLVTNNGMGIINIYGGIITGLIKNENQGVLNVNDGTINGVVNNGIGTVKMIGGTIQNSPYGLYIKDANSKVIIEGGEFKGTTSGIYIPQGMQIKNTGEYQNGYVNLPNGKYITNRTEGKYIVNYLQDGGVLVAELQKTDGTIEKYFSVQDAVENVSGDGLLYTVKMLADEFLGRSIVIDEGKNIKLDLNGKEISANSSAIIENSGKLTLCDLSESKSGKIIYAEKGIVNKEKANLSIISLSLISKDYSSVNVAPREMYAIYNEGSGDITVSESFIQCKGRRTFGIYNNMQGTINLINVNIMLSPVGSSDVFGVYNKGNGIINMLGGSIKINSTGTYIYGIYDADNGTINVNNSTIIVNSNFHSYGIYKLGTGTIAISGDIIVTTNTDNTGSSCNAIFTKNVNSKLIINGGTYKGKKGISVPDGMIVKNSGEFENGYVNIPQGKHIAYTNEEKYVINYLEEGNAVELQKPSGIVEEYSSIQEAIKNSAEDGTLHKIKLLTNEQLLTSVQIAEEQNIEIDLNGNEINANTLSRVIINNGDLTIIDSSSEKNGLIDCGREGIYNAGSKSLILNGCTISAVYNVGTGNIEINGCVIQSICNKGTGNIIVNKTKINTDSVYIGANIMGYAYRISVYNSDAGKIDINESTLTGISLSNKYKMCGIYNVKSGTINILNSNIYIETPINLYGIYSNGNINIDGGSVTTFASESNYGHCIDIYGNGSLTIKDVVLKSLCQKNNYANYFTYGIYFDSTSSNFKFISGKIIAGKIAIYPENKKIEMEANKYLKVHNEYIDGIKYNIAEIVDDGEILVINNGYEERFGSLESAMAKAITYNTFTQVKLLADATIASDITIPSNKYIQLDLNGKTIKYYSNVNTIKAFINNGRFELTDSLGNGKIEVIADGYDAYGVCNNESIAMFKQLGGNIEVISRGANAYGISNSGEGLEAIVIDGGSISAKAEIGTNSIKSGIAYGIYNASDGTIMIGSDSTKIVASSDLNDGYGIYDNEKNNELLIGEKDGLTNSNSPYISGNTCGVYKEDTGKFALYGGSVTGPTSKSTNRKFNEKEENTALYTLDNLDGTETQLLLKNIDSIDGVPEQLTFNKIGLTKSFEVSYLPIDASDVTITHEIKSGDVVDVTESYNTYKLKSKAEGSAVMKITARDITGKEVFAICNIIVDLTAPTDTAPDATSTATSVKITCKQEDENIDANTIRYAISSDGGLTWGTWTSRSTISGLTPDTEYLVKTKVSDLAGNENESKTTKIKTKLSNNSKLTLEPDTMTKENVKVIITWNNPESIPQYYKINDGEWIFAGEEITELVVSEGNTTVYTKLVYDETEDSYINSIIVDNIDRLLPTGTFTINESKPNYAGYVTLDIKTSDDATVSGDNAGVVAFIYISEENIKPTEDNENWIIYSGDTNAYKYKVQNADGNTTIYMWFMDKVHNISKEPASANMIYEQAVATLVEDGVVVGEYDSIQLAYNFARENAATASTIIISKDTTLSETLVIEGTKDIILDLNGRTVTSELEVGIKNEGKLEITDSRGKGKYINTYTKNIACAIHNTNKLYISNGNVQMVNKTSSEYPIRAIYNDGSYSKLNMTGGRVYAEGTLDTDLDTGVYAIYNSSTLMSETSITITGGTVETNVTGYSDGYGIYNSDHGYMEIHNLNVVTKAVNGKAYGIRCEFPSVTIAEINIQDSKINVMSENSDAYGIHNNYDGWICIISGDINAISNDGTSYGIYDKDEGVIRFISGTIKSTSTNGIGYGIYNDALAPIEIGDVGGTIDNDLLTIFGSTYGIYRNKGGYVFEDGKIQGPIKQSISCTKGDLILPENYGVIKTIKDGVETSTLMYDDTAPTIESINITTEMANKQTITVTGATDIGTGIVGYILSNSSAVPTLLSTEWQDVEATTGPVDYSFDATINATYYFWLIDAAGNISETYSVKAMNIVEKITEVQIEDIDIFVGNKVGVNLELLPQNGQFKLITLTVDNDEIASANSDNGLIVGLSAGTTTLTCSVLNFDGTYAKGTCNVTVRDVSSGPIILVEPQDRTVKEGTPVEFKVVASGDNLQYQWLELTENRPILLDDEHCGIFKSNIEGEANTIAKDTIIINTDKEGKLNFEYMVSSEASGDTFKITVEDANGERTLVDNISGEMSWKYIEEATVPNTNNQIKLTLIYTKNESGDAGADYGAIRFLNYYYLEGVKAKSTFKSDEYFKIKSPDTTVNGSSKHTWITATEDGVLIYKSNNKGVSSSYATASIEISVPTSGRLSFDWRVSSESVSYDYLEVYLTDATGRTQILKKGGTTTDVANWKTYSKNVTPDASGKVKLTLLYRKDGSVNRGDDIAAIRNLIFDSSIEKTISSTFNLDETFTVSKSNFEVVNYSGANSPVLQIPGKLVRKDVSGTGYGCWITNDFGEKGSKVAVLTIADEEIPLETPMTKNPPTLETSYKQITATCNQSGENITKIYYAITSNGTDYSEWQESNVFKDLEEDVLYGVKTKIVNASGEQESELAITYMPIYTVTLEENGVITYYKTVQDAINAANAENKTEKSIITLLNGQSTSKRIFVDTGKNIFLDLNGYNISVINALDEDLYGIYNKGKLEIFNSGDYCRIEIIFQNESSDYRVYGIYNDNGTVIVNGVNMVVDTPETCKANTYAIYNNGGTTAFGIDDGNIYYNEQMIRSTGYGLYNNNGTVNYYDGVIVADKGKTVKGKINILDNYKIETETNGVQDAAYLTELVLDIESAMITEWQVPANTEITLPISNGENVDIVVDYGDGNVKWVKGEAFPKHTYQIAGTYQIKISGILSDFGNYSESEITSGSNYYTFTNYMTRLTKWGELRSIKIRFCKL